MREILFRGFYENKNGTEKVFCGGKWYKGEWVEGCYFIAKDNKCNLLHYISEIKGEQIFKIIPETLRQYTGKNDINGNNIFENHIVKNCDGDIGVRIVIPKDEMQENAKKSIDIFTDNEIKLITQNCNGYMYYLFKLALATGLREGELLGLELGSIDFDKAEITVKQALKEVNIYEDENTSRRELQLSTTKNKKTRTVPIPQALISDLKKHINNQRETFLSCGLIYNDTDFLFTTKGCLPINARNMQRAWRRTLTRANVRYRKFHNVRHTYASKLLENGVDIKTISTLLGHSNISITADIYVHVIPEVKADAASRINYLFAE